MMYNPIDAVVVFSAVGGVLGILIIGLVCIVCMVVCVCGVCLGPECCYCLMVSRDKPIGRDISYI